MTAKNSLEIIYLSATAIKPSPHAARQHSSAQRRKLKAILRQFGQVVPLPLFDLNGEASTARTKQISAIIAPT